MITPNEIVDENVADFLDCHAEENLYVLSVGIVSWNVIWIGIMDVM
jgi:hypothetical protein